MAVNLCSLKLAGHTMLFICYTVALDIQKADLPHIRSLNHFIIGLSAGKANQPLLTDKCCFKTDEILQNVILLQHDQISVADIACTAQRHKMFAIKNSIKDTLSTPSPTTNRITPFPEKEPLQFVRSSVG
jgi:hypothetical protein